MNEKLSLQHIADVLAQKKGMSKKMAESFSKAFFDTIVEAFAMGGGSVKIKGLGTFKLVSVERRESVNISNGERIVISGYKKVTFVPEDSVVETLNCDVNKNDVVEKEAVMALDQDVEKGGEAENEALLDVVGQLVEVPLPVQVERPSNEFAGIDLLISTPESVEDIRRQYAEAEEKMDLAVEEARKAYAEKLRLERLLERLEANCAPEKIEERSVEEQKCERETSGLPTLPVLETSVIPDTPSSKESLCNEDPCTEALQRYMNEEPTHENSSVNEEKRRLTTTMLWGVPLVVVVLGAIVFFLYKTSCSIESVEKVTSVEQPSRLTVSAKKSTSKKAHQKQEIVKGEPTGQEVRSDSVSAFSLGIEGEGNKSVVETEPARPTTYQIQRGESLTRVSQRFYGTKDSVRAIIRVNVFADPNNVPVGAVIKLP